MIARRKDLVFLAMLSILSCSHNDSSKGFELMPVRDGKLFQYIDRRGRIVVNPQFDRADLFSQGLALVEMDGKWGFIDMNGKFVIHPMYKQATAFNESYAWAVQENSAPLLIDANGNVKLTLKTAKRVSIFREGLASFQTLGSEAKYGFVDFEGNIKINPQFFSTGYFSAGKCAVRNIAGKWGYIDDTGTLIINYKFDQAEEFSNGRAVVYFNRRAGLIDEEGRYLINPQFSSMKNDGDVFLIQQGGSWGWCDRDGKFVINPQFDEAFPFGESSFAPVKFGDQWGYIDKNGKISVTPQFDFALPFMGAVACVVSDGKIGMIDKDGRYMINPQYEADLNGLRVLQRTHASAYAAVESDFFDLSAIIGRISLEFQRIEKGELDFESPIYEILHRINKSESDLGNDGIYVTQNEVLSEHSSFDHFISFRPWVREYAENAWQYRNVFNKNGTADYFLLKINLLGKGMAKKELIVQQLQELLSRHSRESMSTTEMKFKNPESKLPYVFMSWQFSHISLAIYKSE